MMHSEVFYILHVQVFYILQVFYAHMNILNLVMVTWIYVTTCF